MRFFFVTFAILFLPLGALAGTLNGTFTFKKKPPSVALIYFEDDTSGVTSNPTVDQKDQNFDQKLYVAQTGSTIDFKNSDSIDHNVYADDKKNNVKFDKGLGKPGTTLQEVVKWDSGKVVKVGCMIHPKMKSYIASIKSKYFTTVNFNRKEKTATFKIENVPAGIKKVRIWLPKFEDIVIDADASDKKADLVKKGKTRGEVSVNLK